MDAITNQKKLYGKLTTVSIAMEPIVIVSIVEEQTGCKSEDVPDQCCQISLTLSPILLIGEYLIDLHGLMDFQEFISLLN